MRRRETMIAHPWWTEKSEGKRHDDVTSMAKIIRRQMDGRLSEDAHHRNLYGNLDVAGQGTGKGSYSRGRREARARYNLVASAVDTAQSLVTSQKPKPMYLTAEGDFAQQRQARLRSRALEGQLDDSGFYDIAPEVFLDGAIEGTGAAYFYLDQYGDVQCERVLPGELLVDHAEGIARKPRTLYRQRLIAREVAKAMWPEHAAEIAQSDGPDAEQRKDFYLGLDDTADQVFIVEAWHLPSGPDAGDGMHVVCTSKATLVEEEYTRPRFPFAFYRWKNRRFGFWGTGIVEQCRDPQWRINRLIRRAERSADLTANKTLLVDKRSDVQINHLTNDPFIVVKYDGRGSPPQIVENSSFDPSTQAAVAQIREETFSELGLSVQTAEGKKPSGLDSGAAQRAHDDINSRRHLEPTKRYESFAMEAVQVIEDLNEEAYKLHGSRKIQGRTQRGSASLIFEVDWASIRDPENKLRIRAFPTSFLPSTPQGKLAAVQEIIQTGLVSRPFAQSLLDFPDIDAATRIELADLDFVQWQVEKMLDGDPQYPDPHMQTSFSLELVRKSYLMARTQGAPDSTLDLLREYMRLTEEMIVQAQPAQQPQPQPQPQPAAGPQPAPPPQGAAIV